MRQIRAILFKDVKPGIFRGDADGEILDPDAFPRIPVFNMASGHGFPDDKKDHICDANLVFRNSNLYAEFEVDEELFPSNDGHFTFICEDYSKGRVLSLVWVSWPDPNVLLSGNPELLEIINDPICELCGKPKLTFEDRALVDCCEERRAFNIWRNTVLFGNPDVELPKGVIYANAKYIERKRSNED